MSKEIKVGDRVKVEFEAEVIDVYQQKFFEIVTSAEGDRGWFGSNVLTLVAKGIVLPTKRNALIEICHVYVWRFDGHLWHAGTTNARTPEKMQEVADRNRLTYRVIFEGEDD